MSENIISRISAQKSYLNPALQRIGQYILDNKEKCKTITIKELAVTCGVAESTVTRFVKEIGFSGFQEMKISLAEYLSQSEAEIQQVESTIYEDISKNDTFEDIVKKIYHKNIQKITETMETLYGPALQEVVNVISEAKQLIFVSTGSSSVASEEAVMRFTRSGKKCIYWKDYALQLMYSSIVLEGDVLIAISVSGRTKIVVDSVELARLNGAKTIGITSDPQSQLAKACEYTLFTPNRNGKSLSAQHWESTSSKAAQIFLIDILYACYAVKNYDQTLDCLNKTYVAIKDTRYSN